MLQPTKQQPVAATKAPLPPPAKFSFAKPTLASLFKTTAAAPINATPTSSSNNSQSFETQLKNLKRENETLRSRNAFLEKDASMRLKALELEFNTLVAKFGMHPSIAAAATTTTTTTTTAIKPKPKPKPKANKPVDSTTATTTTTPSTITTGATKTSTATPTTHGISHILNPPVILSLGPEIYACPYSGCTREFDTREKLKKHRSEYHASINVLFEGSTTKTAIERDERGLLNCACGKYITPRVAAMRIHAKKCAGTYLLGRVGMSKTANKPEKVAAVAVEEKQEGSVDDNGDDHVEFDIVRSSSLARDEEDEEEEEDDNYDEGEQYDNDNLMSDALIVDLSMD
ncbi:hypothetical protein BDR26DRAFT_866997 [Obelidium mucronatum]|nr:hypothetical protein BDR26DRAFT_866997 [Obelidium mucronatum]